MLPGGKILLTLSFGTLDDFVLQGCVEAVEIITESGYTDDQVVKFPGVTVYVANPVGLPRGLDPARIVLMLSWMYFSPDHKKGSVKTFACYNPT